ncbi:signal peptidase II [Frigidibacter oleivorans]|uniref:signal peptidase II n=1 Tax=Frigidibacter oleivorans TaxID=2487129 RepID=UPI002E264014
MTAARAARPTMRAVIWTAVAVFLIDQISKYWVVHILQLDRRREIDVLPGWLHFRMAWNQGINFGLFAGEGWTRWLLIALALAIAGWVWRWMARSRPGRWAQISAGLLIGGALGNVVDRLVYGAVADFLNMGFPGFDNPYSFNVADIAIFAGAAGLVLFTGDAKPR